jgi:hypothetical protein
MPVRVPLGLLANDVEEGEFGAVEDQPRAHHPVPLLPR